MFFKKSNFNQIFKNQKKKISKKKQLNLYFFCYCYDELILSSPGGINKAKNLERKCGNALIDGTQVVSVVWANANVLLLLLLLFVW